MIHLALVRQVFANIPCTWNIRYNLAEGSLAFLSSHRFTLAPQGTDGCARCEERRVLQWPWGILVPCGNLAVGVPHRWERGLVMGSHSSREVKALGVTLRGRSTHGWGHGGRGWERGWPVCWGVLGEGCTGRSQHLGDAKSHGGGWGGG